MILRGREGFSKGLDYRGIMVDAKGALRPGWSRTIQDLANEAAAWCGVQGPSGAWLGTTSGKIFFASAGQAKLEYDTGEMLVTGLAVLGSELYAATVPPARIYRRSAQGEWKRHIDLPSRYVWDLVVSRGELFAACGQPAALVQVSGPGAPKTLSSPKADHVLSVLPERAGFWIGTANPGQLIELPSGRVVRDFAGAEVRAIARVGSDLWVAANPSGVGPADLVRTAQGQAAEPLAASGANRTPVTSSLWKVTRERTDEVAIFPQTWISALHPDEPGILVGTVNSGRVFRVLPDSNIETVDDLKAGQVTGFVRGQSPGGLGVLLGNRGRVAWVRQAPADEPTYTAAVHDAGFMSEWGILDLKGSGKFTAQVRSGTAVRPDEGWSEWKTVPKFPCKIPSPRGRYLQIRISLQDASSLVTEARFSYRNVNQAPRLSVVKIEPLQFFAPPELPVPGPDGSMRPTALHSAVKNVSWQAVDPDGDELVFSVLAREQSSDVWIPLADSLTQPAYRWNTDSIADGVYVLKVRASDERSNHEGESLSAEIESAPVLVNNSKPAVTLRVENGRLSGQAKDKSSRITRLELQIDGGEWRSIIPKNGIFDSNLEEFDVPLDSASPGPHTAAVRAYDEELNVGLASTEFQGK